MPVLPKSLFVLGASLQTARTARRLKRASRAPAAQRTAFANLTGRLAATAFGRENGIESRLPYETFRTRVPVRGYEQFSPYIERMKRGEADVLWPGRCALYALSSGTTGDRPKWLPVTDEMFAHFRAASLAAVLFYTARVGHSGVFQGRHLFLGGSTGLAPLLPAKPFAAFAGDLSNLATLHLPPSVEHHLYEPGTAIAQMSDWPAKLAAIVARTRSLDISLLAGLPHWLLTLTDALITATDERAPRAARLQSIWPNLECIVHGGVPLAPFLEELRHVAGSSVNFHEVYPASEGFIAAQDAEPADGLRLLAEQGVFFEFLPLRDFDDTLPSALGAKALPLDGVRAGEDYVLLLTTPAGLTRYVLGDIVRITSTQPPRLIYVGRTRLQLNALGEHVGEKELTDALAGVCNRHGWSLVNFHVAPLFATSLTGHRTGRHEWWVELKPGTIETPTGPLLAAALDRDLSTLSRNYAAKRKSGGLEAPFVRLVMPGFFAHWLRHHGKWGGQHKMPRCRSDRHIADELTAMACFNAD